MNRQQTTTAIAFGNWWEAFVEDAGGSLERGLKILKFSPPVPLPLLGTPPLATGTRWNSKPIQLPGEKCKND
jgi:hypothetical protein